MALPVGNACPHQKNPEFCSDCLNGRITELERSLQTANLVIHDLTNGITGTSQKDRIEELERRLPEKHPHISINADDELCLEWWRNEKKLTIYGSAPYILKSWGPHIENDMEDVEPIAEDIKAAFDWLYGAALGGAREVELIATKNDVQANRHAAEMIRSQEQRRVIHNWHQQCVENGYDGVQPALNRLFAMEKGPREVE